MSWVPRGRLAMALPQTSSGAILPSRHAAAREELPRFEAAFAPLPPEPIAATTPQSPQPVRNLPCRALARLAERMTCTPGA